MTVAASTNGHLTRPRTSGLLRFATAGSVDDGKSTLIGRLLHDSKAILEDQLELEATTQAEQTQTADFREGVTAFREKRNARFTGA